MNMDIDDILREFAAPNRDLFSEDNSSSGLPSGQADLQALTRAWVNERGATELLPYAPYAAFNPLANITQAGRGTI